MNDFERVCEGFSGVITAVSFTIGILDDRFEFIAVSVCALFCMALVLLFENLEG